MHQIWMHYVQRHQRLDVKVGRTDRLGDRKCRTEGHELYCDKEKDARFAHVAEGLVIRRHLAIRKEVENFLGNAVPREFVKAHVPAYEANMRHQHPS
jgi:hypothetical protein